MKHAPYIVAAIIVLMLYRVFIVDRVLNSVTNKIETHIIQADGGQLWKN